MTLQAYPVRLEGGVVKSVDGTPLPEQAYAVLVILPAPARTMSLEEWQKPFDAFFAAVQAHPPIRDLSKVTDAELSALVHSARKPQ
ncbi:MAG: hypothetical protein HY023_08270 [Chloroflexi bacterium]|nr:hypothetical protein [Chloroflexota bacterium]